MAFPPVRFGRYYLFDKIAVGGMAEVFKAKRVSHHHFEMLIVIHFLKNLQITFFCLALF